MVSWIKQYLERSTIWLPKKRIFPNGPSRLRYNDVRSKLLQSQPLLGILWHGECIPESLDPSYHLYTTSSRTMSSPIHIDPKFSSRSCLPGPCRWAFIQHLSSRKWDPQGSSLSSNSFILSINNITSIIPVPLRTILFADDLSIHFQSKLEDASKRPFLWSTSGVLPLKQP